jgi:DNA modification methylase
MINGRNLKELQQEAENVGFQFQNILVWNKGNATPNRYYLNACEFILMLRKGNAKI